ncbi:LacI family DNA-binding transcriptional regulator [Evansella tamaricis]|uniref:LacI family DNA-binding transcriptional regulator n=1 Tax=Evansella tamaricis TaxID=2069301 RepID=A0ABS6JC14_9BACI|nr:LacI family DNA-binding transcriptional regulator [Evansella tamaricis]MBU9711224.1 LacI family DNA-binding transcriptional regulator [Evansella tamaricis]
MKIKDIAKLANVSVSAVSLALNGKPGISEATREKIVKISREHGYTTRSIAKKEEYISSKVVKFVACTGASIVSEKYETLPFFTELIHDFSEKIKEKGYSLMVSTINIQDFHKEISLLGDDPAGNGIILLGTNLNYEQISFANEKINNLVVIDTCFETLNVDFVVMNNLLGAYLVALYLVENGHTSIGYVESDSRIYNFDMRKRAFYQALDERGLTIDKEYIFKIKPTDISAQDNFIKRIDNLSTLPTALFCECDYMAISIIKALSEVGIHVPQDISVIGFDDIREAQIIHPELTTIHVPKYTIASMAVERLIEKIENETKDSLKILVDTDLVERNSCKRLD